jgi:hypothetical protein
VAIEMCEIIHGENYSQALKAVHLSNTMMWQTESEGIEEQLLTQVKCSPKFAIQIDESTDVAGLPQLFVFIGYCFQENINEDFMLCQPLTKRTTGSDTFKAVNDYNFRKYFLVKLCQHLYKWSSSYGRKKKKAFKLNLK